jgi:hypothetical protein
MNSIPGNGFVRTRQTYQKRYNFSRRLSIESSETWAGRRRTVTPTGNYSLGFDPRLLSQEELNLLVLLSIINSFSSLSAMISSDYSTSPNLSYRQCTITVKHPFTLLLRIVGDAAFCISRRPGLVA